MYVSARPFTETVNTSSIRSPAFSSHGGWRRIEKASHQAASLLRCTKRFWGKENDISSPPVVANVTRRTSRPVKSPLRRSFVGNTPDLPVSVRQAAPLNAVNGR